MEMEKRKVGRPGLSYDQIAQAANELRAAGQSVTIDAVRQALGNTGGKGTIHTALKTWREANPPISAPPPELPSGMLRAIREGLDQTATEAKIDIQRQLVQAQDVADVLAETVTTLETEQEALRDAVTALTSERDQATALSQERGQEVQRLNELLAREQSAAEAARLELAKGQLAAKADAEKVVEQSAKIKDLNDDIAQLRKELATAQAGQLAADKALAEATAKKEAAQEAKLEALEREQEAKAAAKKAELKLADVEKTLIEERARATSAETTKTLLEKQIMDLQAKLELAEARAERAETRLGKAVETYQVFASAIKTNPGGEEGRPKARTRGASERQQDLGEALDDMLGKTKKNVAKEAQIPGQI